ncbi:serine hydrolase domain-containing protein [Paeniglutamicibacter sp. NPDC091659]|uniref:serine hydrolase domain-containing protein n=1 Tax=Paeniglutamicibacter sp. NPDC091659 TaxID=3364389 RepID=UPI0037F4334F
MDESRALEDLLALLPSGSVAAYRGPEEPFGNISHSGSTEPLPVYSVTKMFIAAGVLRAMDAGELKLSDSLASRLEGAPTGCTIREVLHHTAGLGNYTAHPDYVRAVAEMPGEPWGLERIAAASVPGTRGSFEYSNTGFWYLGAMLEQVSGMALGQYLHREVFEPANMMDTRYPDLETSITPSGYSTLWAGPAGAAFSTPADLLRFQQFILGVESFWLPPLSAAATHEFFDSVPVPAQDPWRVPRYGAGVMMDPALAIWGHGGSGPGYRSAVFGRFGSRAAAAVICPGAGSFEAEDALARMLGRKGRHSLVFGPDYAMKWPFTDDSSTLEIEPQELGLSEELTQRLRAWMDGWDAHFHHERGWVDERTRVASRVERLSIQEAIRAEAGDYLDIVDDVFFD